MIDKTGKANFKIMIIHRRKRGDHTGKLKQSF
jgi:hypothetical protein